MSATGSVNMRGTVSVVSSQRETTIALLQILVELETKAYEFTVAKNTTSFLAVPLPFSAGVAEALYVHLYAPKALILELTYTSTSGSNGGPVEAGLKGHRIETLTPGEGLAALRVKNLSTSDDVVLDLVVGAKQKASDTPPFWE